MRKIESEMNDESLKDAVSFILERDVSYFVLKDETVLVAVNGGGQVKLYKASQPPLCVDKDEYQTGKYDKYKIVMNRNGGQLWLLPVDTQELNDVITSQNDLHKNNYETESNTLKYILDKGVTEAKAVNYSKRRQFTIQNNVFSGDFGENGSHEFAGSMCGVVTNDSTARVEWKGTPMTDEEDLESRHKISTDEANIDREW